MVHSSHGYHCLKHKDTGFSRGGGYRFTLNYFKHSIAPKTLLLSRAETGISAQYGYWLSITWSDQVSMGHSLSFRTVE